MDAGQGHNGGGQQQGTAARVLIADDSPFVLRMIEKMLTGAGLEVVKARDGLEAIEMALTHDVRLIILDVMMPRMNGYQACRLLKTEPATRHLPVVILTSKDQVGDRFWGLETGADHFITKDAEPQRILELVKQVLTGPAMPRPDLVGLVPDPNADREASSIDVLSRVNELLDRKLYEATILSEIGRVARSLVSFDETFRSVMGLVARAVDFTLGSLVFVEDDSVEVATLLVRPMSSSVVEEARRLTLEKLLSQRDGAPFAQVVQRVYQAPEGTGPEEQALGGFVAAPIITAGRVTGMLALAGKAAGRVSTETEPFLAQVANQAMIVSENSRLFDRVRNLSIRDGLTGVFNRRHVMEVLGIEYERSARYNSAMSVIMVDIDHFKKINDNYHHQAGDAVIRDVAKLLADSVRSVDSVGRYGGEEFIAILPHTPNEGARLIAERVRRGVEGQLFRVAVDKDIRCTVSVGVASAPSDGVRSATDVVREADKALYRAKEGGRNQVV